MNGINAVFLLGTLGRDPELRFIQSGKAVTNLSLATSEQWTDAGGQKHENTQWHDVTIWGKQAETACTYLQKGSNVCIQGRMKTDKYEKDGVTHWRTKVVCERMTMVGNRPSGGAQDAARAPSSRSRPEPQAVESVPYDSGIDPELVPQNPEDDDQIPF